MKSPNCIEHILGKSACDHYIKKTDPSLQTIAAGDIWVGHESKLHLCFVVCPFFDDSGTQFNIQDLLPWRPMREWQMFNFLQLNFRRRLLL